MFYHCFGSADIYFRLNVFRSTHDRGHSRIFVKEEGYCVTLLRLVSHCYHIELKSPAVHGKLLSRGVIFPALILRADNRHLWPQPPSSSAALWGRLGQGCHRRVYRGMLVFVCGFLLTVVTGGYDACFSIHSRRETEVEQEHVKGKQTWTNGLSHVPLCTCTHTWFFLTFSHKLH